MIDADLAALYGVSTKRLNEQVRRNSERFPPDFVFQLTPEEHTTLRSQFATSNQAIGRGGRRYLPYACFLVCWILFLVWSFIKNITR